MRLLPLVLPALALLAAACDSENVSWAFVSNPGGSFGEQGGGIIVVKKNAAPSNDDPQRWIGVMGTDRRGPVQALLLTQGDVALLVYEDRVDVHCPRLPGGVFRSSPRPDEFVRPADGGMAFALRVVETQQLHPQAFGPGRLIGAAFGSLLVLEHGSGLVVFGDDPEPRILPEHRLQVVGAEFRAIAPDQTVRFLRAPAPPPVGERLQTNTQRGSVTIRGPGGTRLAEVPQERVQVGDGSDGLLFRASFPDGLGRGHPDPFALLGPRNNRHLLRLDG